MGIFLKIFAMIMGFLMAIFVKTPTTVYEPETVEINGVKYKNCFVNEATYFTDQDFYYDIEPFYKGSLGTEWYRINDKYIFRYQRTELNFKPKCYFIYCPENEWEQTKDYYYNTDNWTCSVVSSYENGEIWNWEPIFERTFDKVDTEKWNKLITRFAVGSDYDASEAIDLPINSETLKYDFYLRMKSNDGIFTATSRGFLYYQGEFYCEYIHVGGSYIVAVKVPSEFQGYLKELSAGYVE